MAELSYFVFTKHVRHERASEKLCDHFEEGPFTFVAPQGAFVLNPALSSKSEIKCSNNNSSRRGVPGSNHFQIEVPNSNSSFISFGLLDRRKFEKHCSIKCAVRVQTNIGFKLFFRLPFLRCAYTCTFAEGLM